MSGEEFDFEEARRSWPDHWDHDDKGWPTVGSTWRARRFPQMRVSVVGRSEEYMTVIVYWDGDVDGLRRLFTHDSTERWEISKDGLVHMPEGIGPWEQGGPAGDGRHWRRDDWLLDVYFERAMFGGPDTWHYGHGEWESLPFFEPIQEYGE